MGAATVNCVLSSTPNRKDFPISRFFLPPSLQDTIDTRETFTLAQRTGFDHLPQCPIFPQLRE